MNLIEVEQGFTVSAQVATDQMSTLVSRGVKSIVVNRPDGEAADQPTFAELQELAQQLGIQIVHIPITPGQFEADEISSFSNALNDLPKPVHAFCRTGTRSITLWALAQAQDGEDVNSLIATASGAGFDISGALSNKGFTASEPEQANRSKADSFDVVVIGGGAAGIAVASSILARTDKLSVAIVDAAEAHYYQPGWTMVGGGIFQPAETVRTMASVMPTGVSWIKCAAASISPEAKEVILENTQTVAYDRLVVAPGLKLDWGAIEGLGETLGRNGVTSNYRFDLAPYTWQLVSGLKRGKAIFTQPPMPIKCAGAPQKAMYLSGDYWYRQNLLDGIQIDFYNAGGALFGVSAYVPALMEYVERYNAGLHFAHNLVRVDGETQTAWFQATDGAGETSEVAADFDMLHVCPPQTAPDFIRASTLSDDAGWIDVDQHTLRHQQFDDIWSLGDVMNAPNAKTAAAARAQAPVVANNVLESLGLASGIAQYNGYGSCPLTVERGKIVLAEFGYGGALLPSFPKWVVDGQRPSRLAWLLKERILPPIYWRAMLRGREWMVRPEIQQN